MLRDSFVSDPREGSSIILNNLKKSFDTEPLFYTIPPLSIFEA